MGEKKLVLENVRMKFANVRENCPDVHESLYLVTDYMSTFVNEQLVPIGMAVSLTLLIADLKSAKSNLMLVNIQQLPKELVKYRNTILEHIEEFPNIIDVIADEEFANEFRCILKTVYGWDIPKKIVSEEVLEFPPYVKAAVDWWGDVICNPEFDNGDNSQIGEMASFFGMLLSNPDEPLSRETIELFKKNLGEAILKEFEQHSQVDVNVDYHPCTILKDAAEKSGISTDKFPWKYYMWISEIEISVRKGYNSKVEILWSR